MNRTEIPQTGQPDYTPDGIFGPWVLALIIPMALVLCGNQCLALWVTRNAKPVPAPDDYDSRRTPRHSKKPKMKVNTSPVQSPYRRDIDVDVTLVKRVPKVGGHANKLLIPGSFALQGKHVKSGFWQTRTW
ncbi:hypothetical protein B0T14DRAFT_496425 [Immersiella caudata]|uniref:Uncharacterized protein n=1 Tax=Immersiella caudata TaxID=314043 RepID=A0AA39WQJ5_9PEZI|nr:hypothetical protein B0T14DRAFT_496425 [Immersiella caudata]